MKKTITTNIFQKKMYEAKCKISKVSFPTCLCLTEVTYLATFVDYGLDCASTEVSATTYKATKPS